MPIRLQVFLKWMQKLLLLEPSKRRLQKLKEAEAKAKEAELNATVIVPANKAKEKAIIDAEAVKQEAILKAEAKAAEILKEAEAKANATQMQLEAEAEGTKRKLLAEAEGKRASLMAEADKITAVEMAPAKAVEKMIECGMTPQMIVQYKTVDQLKGIAEASAEMYEHIHLWTSYCFMVMKILLVVSWLKQLRISTQHLNFLRVFLLRRHLKKCLSRIKRIIQPKTTLKL